MPPKARPSRGAAGDAQVVARIGKPHGIRGEVTVSCTDDPAAGSPRHHLPDPRPGRQRHPKALTVRSAGTITASGCSASRRSRTAPARRACVGRCSCSPAEAPEVEDDAWYADDLVGLRAERPDGSLVGTVTRPLSSAPCRFRSSSTWPGRHRRGALRPRPGPRRRRFWRPGRRRPPGPAGAGLMRIDVVTIFPAYLEPLRLSLIGSAQAAGLLDLRVHDLRRTHHDRHRTVDDDPLWRGAGMVMRPEPWGEALDAIRGSEAPPAVPHLVVPSPAGAVHPGPRPGAGCRAWLVFACGRYGGIDERVIREAAGTRPRLGPLARRLRPQRRRGRRPRDGRGGRPARPRRRRQQRVARRGVPRGRPAGAPGLHQAGGLARPRRARGPPQRRPRPHRWLAAGGVAAPHRRAPPRPGPRRRWAISPTWPSSRASRGRPGAARPPAVLLARRGPVNDTWDIPPLVETLDDVRASYSVWRTWVVRSHGRLIASVRGRVDTDGTWEVGRLMVARLAGSRAGSSAPGVCRAGRSTRGHRPLADHRCAERPEYWLYKRAGCRVVLGRHTRAPC